MRSLPLHEVGLLSDVNPASDLLQGYVSLLAIIETRVNPILPSICIIKIRILYDPRYTLLEIGGSIICKLVHVRVGVAVINDLI